MDNLPSSNLPGASQLCDKYKYSENTRTEVTIH
jgi:hypothetical protein